MIHTIGRFISSLVSTPASHHKDENTPATVIGQQGRQLDGNSSMTTMSLRVVLAIFMLADPASAQASLCEQPKHLHMAVGHDSSSTMVVSFASGSCENHPMIPIGAVMYGTSPDRLDHTAVAQSPPFRDNFEKYHHKNGKPRGNYTSDYYHHVLLDNLEPNKKYYYKPKVMWGKLENDASPENEREEEEAYDASRYLRVPVSRSATSVRTEVRSFWTAPPPGEQMKRIRKLDSMLKLAILGDLGYLERSKATMGCLSRQRNSIGAVILSGDIAYPRQKPEFWDAWFDVMDDYPAFSELPLHIAAGNHDIEIRPSGDIFIEYENRFSMPQVQAAELKPYVDATPPLNLAAIPYPLEYDFGNSYYSFIYGTSHNVIINSYANFDPGSKQHEWIVNELASVNRALTPWLFVTMHVPMYNTFHHHDKDVQLLKAKEHLESLFVEYKVNIVFAGHIHAYMRTHPVVNDTVNEKGPVHIIVGDGGRQVDAPFKTLEPEEWVAVRDATYFGFGTIEIFNHTHARWDWVHSAAENKTNVVWQPRHGKNEEELEEITVPPVEHDSAYILNQYFL